MRVTSMASKNSSSTISATASATGSSPLAAKG
jgi:hypothetical protein